jgi:tRNA(Arg) A34 adenosine deaminase TadA
MCLGAIYWSRLDRIYYAATRKDAAAAGFDDSFLYDEVALTLDKRSIPMKPLMRTESLAAFEVWRQQADKIVY